MRLHHRSFFRQLQTTNHHLRQFDHRRPDENCSSSIFLVASIALEFLHLDLHSAKTNERTSIDYSQLLMENQELKSKCDLLQEKLESAERNNIRLIQRWTQQVMPSLFHRTIGGPNVGVFFSLEGPTFSC